MSTPSWQLSGASRDAQSVTADWMPVGTPTIHDVSISESRWITKSNGRLVELYRRDWFATDHRVDQVFHVVLNAASVSAWHVHEHTTDRLFVSSGQARMVLYDARTDSPSYRTVLELLLSEHRPQLIVVPPGIWHGVENIGNAPAVIVNMPDQAYDYEHPDHWRLPATTGEIPYRFRGAPTTGSTV